MVNAITKSQQIIGKLAAKDVMSTVNLPKLTKLAKKTWKALKILPYKRCSGMVLQLLDSSYLMVINVRQDLIMS
jgi:hypothetical protein